MTIAPVSARSLGDALGDRLATIPNLQVFRGEVGTVQTYRPAGFDHAVVKPYAVLYMPPGYRSGTRVGSTRDRFAGNFQVTCVGHNDDTALWVVDRVVATLTGQLVAVPGRDRARRVREDEGNRSLTVQIDEDVTPTRFFVPLGFTITT